jgi:hypothetical protein
VIPFKVDWTSTSYTVKLLADIKMFELANFSILSSYVGSGRKTGSCPWEDGCLLGCSAV